MSMVFEVDSSLLLERPNISGSLSEVADEIVLALRQGRDPLGVSAMGGLQGQRFKSAFLAELRKLFCMKDQTYAEVRARGGVVTKDVVATMSVVVATHLSGEVAGMCTGAVTVIMQGLSGMLVNSLCSVLNGQEC